VIEAPEGKYFTFEDGVVVKSLAELADILGVMPESDFKKHVNEQKNDIAQWIEGVFLDKALGQELRNETTLAGTIRILEMHQYSKTPESFENSEPELQITDTASESVETSKTQESFNQDSSDKQESGTEAQVYKVPEQEPEQEPKQESEQEQETAQDTSEKQKEEKQDTIKVKHIHKQVSEQAKRGLERIQEKIKKKDVRFLDYHEFRRYIIKDFLYGFFFGLIIGLAIAYIL